LTELKKQAFSLLSHWRFDPMTAFLTIVIIPLGYMVLRLIAKYLKDWLSFLLDGLLYALSRVIMHSLASRLTLRRYCIILLASDNRFLHVPSRYDIKLSVDSVFVTLQMEHHGGNKETYTHSDLFDLGNRIRVMGDPGSGKTSLTKRIFRDQCRLAVSHPSKARLPVHIELKTLNIPAGTKEKALGEWLYNHIQALVTAVNVYKIRECFAAYVKGSGLLVLLDGLDEVSKSQYPRVSRAIRQFSDRLSAESDETVVVLTMRTQFYQQIKEDFRDGIGQAVFIRPFKPTDIFEFLTRWPFRSNQHHFLTQIYKDLTDKPTLREMCSNPLVLAMYTAEYESSGTSVAPETRTEFYKRVTEELLIKRRLLQTGKTIAPNKLREQRERILGRLAYEHLLDARQSSNSLRWTEAVKIVKSVMNCETEAAEAAFRELAKETGLISEERHGESLRFIHLTFCEFLAAYEAVQGHKDGWGSLIKANGDFQREQSPQSHPRLLEVIPFAAGLVPRIRRPDIMADITRTGDARLIARCFLETKAYEHESWKPFVNSAKSRLLETPEESWNEEWLRDLHLFNVVVRDEQQCASHTGDGSNNEIDLGDFYRTLVAKQQNNLRTLLAAYAAQDAAAVFRLAEVCELDLLTDYPAIIIDSLDQNPFFELAVDHALHDESRLGDWAVLFAEAALRSSVVAQKMSRTEADKHLERHTDSVSRRKQWRGRSLNSFYGQVITLAANQSSIPDFCQALTILRAVKPPGRLQTNPFFILLPLLGIFSAYGIMISALKDSLHGSTTLVLSRLAVSLALTFAWMQALSSMQHWPRFYAVLLNLRAEFIAPDGAFGANRPWIKQALRLVLRPSLRRSQLEALASMASIRGTEAPKL
jgi:hypothetical protein